MTISVIIPTLNEARHIESALASVSSQSVPAEVIVVDGGSDDETVAIATRHARVLKAERGRARQMNAGAAEASGEILVFLHADTRLPAEGLRVVRSALSDPAVVGGCFRTTFDAESFWLHVWSWRIWMKWHRLAFGDRAPFVRRTVFEAVHGFPDQPLFEDLELVRKVRSAGRFEFLDEAITTSARRFHRHGALRQQLRNAALWFGWLLGLCPERLERWYGYGREDAESPAREGRGPGRMHPALNSSRTSATPH